MYTEWNVLQISEVLPSRAAFCNELLKGNIVVVAIIYEVKSILFYLGRSSRSNRKN